MKEHCLHPTCRSRASRLHRRPNRGVLVAVAVATLIPLVPFGEPAHAARRSRRSAKQRNIRREGSLAPKKDYKLDEQVGKAKDLKAAATWGKGPGLSAKDLGTKRMENMVDEKIEEELHLSKQLLEMEKNCVEASMIRFRLADLYWEKSKRAFFRANDSSLPKREQMRAERNMAQLQELTVQTYEHIVWQCPKYKELPQVLYNVGRCLGEMEQGKKATDYFTQVIREFPSSEWVSYSWFMLGEYYFNDVGAATKALRAYNKAARVPNSPVYGFALYKQGWCYINTGDWDLALRRFRQALRVAEDPEQQMDERLRKGLRKEALKDYVRAYSHVGNAAGAYQAFLKLGGSDAIADMLERLGSWYVSQGAHRDVIAVHRDIIRHFPQSSRLPVYQGLIVDAWSRLGDMSATIEQVKVLSAYLKTMRERMARGEYGKANVKKASKDASDAEEVGENTVRRIAVAQHKTARKLRATARKRAYRQALDLYRLYLGMFPEGKPDAEVNYPLFIRFYEGEIFYALDQLKDAAASYDAVLKMAAAPRNKREKKIFLAAAEEAVRTYDELSQEHERRHPPKTGGTEKKPIPEIQLKLVEACERYINHVGDKGDKIVEIRYKMARIFYSYNHFDRAAPAFRDIVSKYPTNSVACYAANLTLDIFNGLKDYDGLRKTARAYLANKRLACGPQERTKFAEIERQSAFGLVKSELEDKNKYVAAANAYMQFYREYSKTDLADDAVYNAAVNYDRANEQDKANEVRRFLVERLPQSSLAADTLRDMAASYERVFDLKQAASRLELFAERYPKDKRSKDALFNAATYREALQDFVGAKDNRQRFVSLYPNDRDVHRIALSICEAAEKEAKLLNKPTARGGSARASSRTLRRKWKEAQDCYHGWASTASFAKADPDLLCYALARRAEIMRTQTTGEAAAAPERRYVINQWPKWRKRYGNKRLERCGAAVAELKFRNLQADVDSYKQMSISELNPTKTKRFDTSVRTKIAARDKLIKAYRDVVALGDAEWALASLFVIGELYVDSIEKLLQAPIPDKIPGYELTEEDKGMLRQQLRQMSAPIEGLAIEAYQLCVAKAHELAVYSEWSTRAAKRLQELRPDAYAPFESRVPPLDVSLSLPVTANGVVVAEGGGYEPLDLKLRSEYETKRRRPGRAATTTAGSKHDIPAPLPEGN